MVDIKKLDWTKCKLPNIAKDCNAMFAKAAGDEVQVCITDVMDGHCDVLATRSSWSGEWFTGPHIDARYIESLLNIHDATKVADSFIAAETARIEAEEAAKSHVTVPWQDVEWLRGIGVKVQRLLYGTKDWVAAPPLEPVYPAEPYRAHRDALPAGYDPEKPRWVEVASVDVLRLEHAGAVCYTRVKSESGAVSWSKRVPGTFQDGFREYAVDIRTLAAGVPLHEEPNPVPRPCTKGFALKHPKESEWKYGSYEWVRFSDRRPALNRPDDEYRFRTTAPEEPAAKPKQRVVAEVAVTNLIYKEKVTNTMPLRIWREAVIDFGCDGQDARGRLYIHLGYDDHEISDKAKGKNPRIALIVDEES